MEFKPKKATNIEELEELLKDAEKGIAKVDKTYVNYKNPGHLYQYDINFEKFLKNINYILENAQK
jgi:hypothetical protein